MRKFLTVSLLVALTALLAGSCKGKDKAVAGGDPKTVVAAFFEKMGNKDIDGAAKLCTEDSKATLDMMKKAIEAGEKLKGTTTVKEDDGTEDFKNMEIGETKINGNDATVSITNKKKNETLEFPLKKEGGDWKVDFSMGTLMKMGLDANKNKNGDTDTNNNNDTTGINDLKNMLNSDTLKKAMDQAKELLEKIKPEDIEKMKEVLKEQ